MTATDSITDIDVVLGNVQIFRLLQELPPEQTGQILGQISAAEKSGPLASRWVAHHNRARDFFGAVPALAGDREKLARAWADRCFRRQLDLVQGVMYVCDPRTEVVVSGAEKLAVDPVRGHAPMLVSLHAGVYQLLPPALTRAGVRLAAFMDAGALGLLQALSDEFVPTARAGLELIGLPDRGAATRALAALRGGRPLLVYPEFSLGDAAADRTHVADFFGVKIHAPLGPARLAKACRVPILPVRLITGEVDERRITVHIGDALFDPARPEPPEAVTDRIFSWLEAAVAEDPAAWWCWEIFAQRMMINLAGA